MENRRIILYALLGVIIYFLWHAWQVEHPEVLARHDSPSTLKYPIMPSSEVETETPGQPANNQHTIKPTRHALVHVQTDVYDLAIDNAGNIIRANLKNYPVNIDNPNKPFSLLFDNAYDKYNAVNQLFEKNGVEITPLNIVYDATQSHFVMDDKQKELTVELMGRNLDGLNVIKKYTFKPQSYLIHVDYVIKNNQIKPWKGFLSNQLIRSEPQSEKSSLFQIGSYTGASYSSPGNTRFKKVSFKDMSKSNLDVKSQGGWVAMQEHYFLSAFVPSDKQTNRFYTRTANGLYTIGSVGPIFAINAEGESHVSTKLYLGPEITSQLQAIAPSLDMTIDYGWLWFLSSLLFKVMKWIYSVVGNWGWSIVLVTIAIKLAFFKLSATSYRSMAAMRKLQPKLQALRERYGDDKAAISQKTMALYREEKVNPLGGCLPIIIQIPVFIALYWVLIESVELRQAPFILWIQDLSSADPYHILPLIMGLTMFIQQRLNPAPPDPMQAKVMMFLPVLFTGLFWNFPAGLVLYWIVNNTLSIIQQWYITRHYQDKPLKK